MTEVWEYLWAPMRTKSMMNLQVWSASWTEDGVAKSIQDSTVQAILDSFGLRGWELVTFTVAGGEYAAVFKRRKP